MENIKFTTLTCQICTSLYNDEAHTPIVINCGHTFCKFCLLKLISNDSYKSCPICKKKIESDKNTNESLIPNYELLSLLIQISDKNLENSCESHPSEKLLFFCSKCKVLICQLCLLVNHIGDGHEIKRPEDSELSKSLKIFNDYNKLVKDARETKLQKGLSIRNAFKQIDVEINSVIEKIYLIGNLIKLQYYINNHDVGLIVQSLDKIKDIMKDEYNAIVKKSIKLSIDNETLNIYSNIKQWYDEIEIKLNQKNLFNFDEISKSIDITLKEMLSKKELSLFCNDYLNSDGSLKNNEISKIKNFGDFFIDEKLSNLRYSYFNSSKEHLRLVDLASLRIECDNEYVINIMRSIDRVDFVPSISAHTYSDNPLMIGWNTTISAPYMHMLTLSYLSKLLSVSKKIESVDNVNIKEIEHYKNNACVSKSSFPNYKAIDIGCGSGYMTLALSKLLGPNSIVYGIDHIEEIINYATNNISKSHREYIDSGRIKLILKDGQNGLPLDGTFDIIHVGAAVQEFSKVLFDQLSEGGYMWIPVGPKNAFKNIFLCNKKGEEIIKSELMTCSYAEMTTKEDQLSHCEEYLEENVSIEDELERFLGGG